ncbi:MBL fold metallo-hydrolase [Vacuolonema iberomarrocanum]|uniref:MBL fold metallo-hydrolase n=1 Tax=Vacuolonema iberomarrocanum TaxID=3454632 RepID=UPI0019DB0285|nr:MBL fold metallo-hydrolase [filamentous cyanobacterium LEGE 07170]
MTELACLPYGVGAVQEGVCLLVQMGTHRILLDCGLADLTPLLEKGDFPPADVVLCTHAHSDHARGLLALHRQFPRLPIYASDATTQLLPLNWLEEMEVPVFGRALPWRSPVEVLPGLRVELFPAGHLPGAAAILLTEVTATRDRPLSLFYTGDFFLSNTRLVNGLPLEDVRGLKPDVLIVESTNGLARLPRRRQQENQLAELIYRAIAHQQSVLLPTPTLGLGQELLMLLRSHHHFTGRDIDIWVDPIVAAGCDAYLSLLPHLPSSVQNFARHQPLFWDERVRPHVRRLTADASAWDDKTPAIALVHRRADLTPYLQTPAFPWLLLLPQESHAVPPRLTETQLTPLVKEALNNGQLTVDTYLLSDHCDGSNTAQLIHNLRPQHVVLVHGTESDRAELANLEELQNRYQLHIPGNEQQVELPVGDAFLQPAPPATRYVGEWSEAHEGLSLQLPETLRADPRWEQLANTGIIEARWQGDELVIRGMAQKELSQKQDQTLDFERECCQNCQFCRSHRCWNPASPLHGFRVSPEGYCPAFEAIAPLSADSDSEK